jgi:hypothetical protein
MPRVGCSTKSTPEGALEAVFPHHACHPMLADVVPPVAKALDLRSTA